MSLDVPSSRIHVESFGGAIDVEDPVLSVDAKAVAVLNGRKQSLHVARGQTLLEAMRAAGLSPPYSCQSGVCGACRARLDDGTVHLRAHMALDQLEIESGAILACQAVPTSPAHLHRVSLTARSHSRSNAEDACEHELPLRDERVGSERTSELRGRQGAPPEVRVDTLSINLKRLEHALRPLQRA